MASRWSAPPLERWHTFVPHELRAGELERAGWARYLEAEEEVFRSVEREVSRRLDAEDRVPVNRYFEGSPVHPARFARDWNRSFALVPEGEPGVFSLSHIALPFPIDDALYGLTPDPGEDFGIRLGALAVRGERGVLSASLDSLLRLSSNPFFAYQVARIEDTLGPPSAGSERDPLR